ncbi:HNH endonuclease [Streptomyces sp. NPDC057555]|uniref:HNH endonuclease n=1 Tax=Streptomyces sp. NPDC057555 TaxID=3346166 RepID=UPI0036B37953
MDHVRPLALGGTDTDRNVQVLCRGCHRLKTGAEFGAAAQRRVHQAAPEPLTAVTSVMSHEGMRWMVKCTTPQWSSSHGLFDRGLLFVAMRPCRQLHHGAY